MRNTLQSTGHPPTTKNYLAQNINSSEVETTFFGDVAAGTPGTRHQAPGPSLSLHRITLEKGQSRLFSRLFTFKIGHLKMSVPPSPNGCVPAGEIPGCRQALLCCSHYAPGMAWHLPLTST